MSKFHINDMGNPGPCSAAQGNCPFGGEEEHYNTINQAREAFERSKTEQMFSSLKRSSENQDLYSKTTLPVKELSRLAKESTDLNVLTQAAERGTPRTHVNLTKNKNTPAEVLAKAFERVEDEALGLRLQAHDNFPMGSMTEQGIRKLFFKHPIRFADRVADDTITDVQADQIMKDPQLAAYAAPKMLANRKNKISERKLIELAESNEDNLKIVVANNPRYPVSERIEYLSSSNLNTVARHSAYEDALRKLYTVSEQRNGSSEIDDSLQANPNTPIDVLRMIYKKEKG